MIVSKLTPMHYGALVLILISFILGFGLRTKMGFDDTLIKEERKQNKETIDSLKTIIAGRDKIILDGLKHMEETDSLLDAEHKRRVLAEFKAQRERELRLKGIHSISSDSLRKQILDYYKDI